MYSTCPGLEITWTLAESLHCGTKFLFDLGTPGLWRTYVRAVRDSNRVPFIVLSKKETNVVLNRHSQQNGP
jgi:hypothetical protein